jgi:biopolymer transport protein ExbB/TolQ
MAKRSVLGNWQPVVGSIVIPTALGGSLYFCAMAAIEASGNPFLYRYLAGHPVSRITTALALIGLVALLVTARRVWREFNDPADYAAPVPSKAESAARATALRDLIGGRSRGALGNYRQQRLLAAARFVEQTGSADRLDDELKYLADVDAQRQADGYAFVRILIWAIPMLGFLGTVLGITQALGSIQVGPENDFQQMMNGLRTGLYVAFDTTAQALAFSISLMFVQFAVMRVETQLLEGVDHRVRADLAGWFEIGAADGDAYVRAVQRIGRSILAATHEMSQSQCELWRRSIEAAQAAWMQALSDQHDLVQRNLSDAVHSSVERFAERLGDSIQQVDASLERRGQQWQVHLSQLTRQIHDQQTAVVTSSDAVLAALRDCPPMQQVEAQRLLDAVTLNRTLQDLIQALRGLTGLNRVSSGPLAQGDAPPANTPSSAPLRIFPEDLAA